MARSDTRERIQQVGLELFNEQGYDKTSLREIAERLGVTKAALYYHFKSKDDILTGLIEDYFQEMGELLDWAEAQERTPETKREIIDRYADLARRRIPLITFFQRNPATIQQRQGLGKGIKERIGGFRTVLVEEGSTPEETIKAAFSLMAINFGVTVLQDIVPDEDDRISAAVNVAYELIGLDR